MSRWFFEFFAKRLMEMGYGRLELYNMLFDPKLK
tara:strand:+ start:82 stop:183 length:102 start_codon:yes stop_codon:yes gene_type:complete